MSEPEFWSSLEYRIGGDLRRLNRDELRGLWCDGLEPRLDACDAPRPSISGKAWMMWNRPKPEPGMQDWRPVTVKKRGNLETRWELIPSPRETEVAWTFTCWLPMTVRSRADIGWPALIPSEATGWLTIDLQRAVVGIDCLQSATIH